MQPRKKGSFHLTGPYLRFFLSYAVIFLIPVICLSAFCYTNFIDRFQTMTYEMRRAEQQKQCDDLDTLLEELKNMTVQFSISPQEIRSLDSDVLMRISLMKQLQKLLSMNMRLSDALFWVSEQSMFYSAQTSYASDSYREINREDLPDTLRQAWEEIEQSKRLVINLFSGRQQQGECLFISYPYPYQSVHPSAFLVFCISEPNLLPDVSQPYALKYNGRVLWDGIDLSKVPADAPIVSDGARTTYLTTVSARKNFVLTTQINNAVLFSSIYTVRDAFMFLTLLVTVLSVFLFSLFSYRNGKPIDELNRMLFKLGVIDEKTALKNTQTTQTIAYMKRLSDSNSQLDHKLAEEQYVSHNLWMSKLLNSSEQYLPDIVPHLEKYGIRLDSPYYTVALIYLSTRVQSNLLFDQYLFQEKDYALQYYVDAQNKIFLLIGSNDKGSLRELLGRLMAKLSEMGFASEIFVGATFKGREGIHRAYISALFSVDDEILCDGRLHFLDGQQNEQPFFYPQAELDMLGQSLRDRDAEKFRAVCRSLSYQMTHSYHHDFWYKTVCYEIVNCIIRMYADEENREALLRPINLFLSSLNHTALRREITALFDEFSDTVYQHMLGDAKRRELPAAATLDDMVDYIRANYTDSEFCLTALCDHFGIAQNNLTQQFKRRMGTTPARYIAALRIEDAKKLLIETDMPVKDVARKIGMSDLTTFSRNFHANVNMTPGQFRAVSK